MKKGFIVVGAEDMKQFIHLPRIVLDVFINASKTGVVLALFDENKGEPGFEYFEPHMTSLVVPTLGDTIGRL
jgi:hypothetical protein